ncbi:MAG: hypothetical protein HY649_11860 [Acidobacteria bacterium]|nr:hypothetical protein [Acidobacteriota bacterium]
MDKATLVRSDLEIEGRVQEALSQAKIPVSLVALNYVSEIEEWQLVIATPLYDSKGPHEAVSRIIRALQDAGIYQKVPMLRVSVLSPDDSVVKALEQEIKVRTEGSIHIVAHRNEPNHEKVYAVIFSPYTGPGGAVPARRITGLAELRKFLVERLHIYKTSVDDALPELARKGSTSILNVQLTNREAKRLGLA